jgi:hypothetical protein
MQEQKEKTSPLLGASLNEDTRSIITFKDERQIIDKEDRMTLIEEDYILLRDSVVCPLCDGYKPNSNLSCFSCFGRYHLRTPDERTLIILREKEHELFLEKAETEAKLAEQRRLQEESQNIYKELPSQHYHTTKDSLFEQVLHQCTEEDRRRYTRIMLIGMCGSLLLVVAFVNWLAYTRLLQSERTIALVPSEHSIEGKGPNTNNILSQSLKQDNTRKIKVAESFVKVLFTQQGTSKNKADISSMSKVGNPSATREALEYLGALTIEKSKGSITWTTTSTEFDPSDPNKVIVKGRMETIIDRIHSLETKTIIVKLSPDPRANTEHPEERRYLISGFDIR